MPTMTYKLRPKQSPSPAPFTFDNLPSPSPASPSTSSSFNGLPPPTSWLSARDMKIFGADPLKSTSEIGIVQCKDCAKPILRSAIAEHADNCKKYDLEKNGSKGKADDGECSRVRPLPVHSLICVCVNAQAKGKKRKGEDIDPNDPNAPKSKKAKATATKVTKGRFKGPFDPDRHCGVINDKNLPCSRSLTCKSHSMGAKRAVKGRSKDYDELLLEWNRAHNPNWVEPVKRESKKERKEKKEREKRERKQRELEELAKRKGIDLSKPGAEAQLEQLKSSAKKKKKVENATVAAGGVGAHPSGSSARADDEHGTENLADLDSEEELESMAKSVRLASEANLLGVPLAMPCDAGSWFIVRRERLRTCRDLFAGALMKGGISSVGAAGAAARLGTGTS
ncbi:SCA7, zinc-binding domain-containing protein [Multifurca ochricompacta]|uniref:SCA7, zinc-binding domain-containing protein n=1 Tax=Multifurca ochricompacta TaxID=376703 RepID=A0AAD4QNG8_9AGAM|nr:SCA7, zinc-binding domain-containing protein [Multifurca ochricompacta]